MTLPAMPLIAVFSTRPPEYDSKTQVLVPLNPIRGDDGLMHEAWDVVPRITDPGAPYRQFYDELLVSGAYQVIREQAQTSQTLTLDIVEFLGAVSDAKSGRANINALQQCLANVAVSATNLTAANWAEIGALLEDCGLADTYQLPGVEG